jgi:hypothetical protein
MIRSITTQLANLFAFALLLVVAVALFLSWKKEQSKYKQLLKTTSLLSQESKQLETENGLLMVENTVLSLRAQELTTLLPEIKNEISNLKVKLSKVQNFGVTSFEAAKTVELVLHDTIVLDTQQHKVFSYYDGFFRVNGVLHENKQKLDLSYKDTLVQVVFKGPREKPWLWIFSKRKLMQRVSLKNPNAQIHYSTFLKIQP